MARLSWHQVQVLAHCARTIYGRASEVHRFKKHIERRSMAALKQRGLVEFDDRYETFSPTANGLVALADHGYDVRGEWLGSNQPRKYA